MLNGNSHQMNEHSEQRGLGLQPTRCKAASKRTGRPCGQSVAPGFTGGLKSEVPATPLGPRFWVYYAPWTTRARSAYSFRIVAAMAIWLCPSSDCCERLDA